MKIILHVGAHRTATTTLQRMMGANRTVLEQAKIAYWGPRRTRGGLFHGLIGSTGAVLPWQVNRAEKRIRLGIAQLEDQGVKTLVVSEENMLGTMRDVLETARLYGGAGARVARFTQGMEGHDLTIGLGIRDYAAFWRSVLAFRFERGGPFPRPGLCARLAQQPRRWRDVVAELAQTLPQARIVVWQQDGMGRYPDRLISGLTGRPLCLSGSDAHLNTSPSLASLRAYADACDLPPHLFPNDAGGLMPFDADQRAVLGELYADDIRWLAAGADGLATHFAEPGQKTLRQIGHGRGRPHDGPHRRLADTG